MKGFSVKAALLLFSSLGPLNLGNNGSRCHPKHIRGSALYTFALRLPHWNKSHWDRLGERGGQDEAPFVDEATPRAIKKRS